MNHVAKSPSDQSTTSWKYTVHTKRKFAKKRGSLGDTGFREILFAWETLGSENYGHAQSSSTCTTCVYMYTKVV